MAHKTSDKIGAQANQPNPALKPFEVLVGHWQSTGTHPYIPDQKLHGRVSFEWIEGGAFLLMRSEIDHPQFPDGVGVFGSDDEAGTYYQIYFDERGTSRKYDVSITNSQLKWWRDDQHFSQRYTMSLSPNKLVGQGQMSRHGGEWENDLSMTCTKI